MAALYHSYDLPWTPLPEEARRLRNAFIGALLFATIMGIVIPLLPVPEKPREVEALPPRLAQLVLEKRALPPPPPPAPPEKKEEKKPEEKPKPEEKKEEKMPEPKPVEQPAPPKKNVEEARKKAQQALKSFLGDDLDDLRDVPVLQPKVSGKLAQGGEQPTEFKRDILTSNIAGGSGGIRAPVSSGVGRTDLGSRQTTQVESPVEVVAAASSATEVTASGKKRRSEESVTLALSRAKGSLYQIYNRALRQDPTLEGKVVFEITIDPTGKVLAVKIVSSELKNAELEERLMARIRALDFGALDVDVITVTAPYDFLPAS